VGAVPAPGFVNEIRDLYDYNHIRGLKVPTMWVAHVERPTLVLGGSQSADVINPSSLASADLRRRRGGGGLVLLRPRDIWVDWWIPADDLRWAYDVHVSSNAVGSWWAEALGELVDGEVSVHRGPLSGDPAFRQVCFAGQGPGEVFVDGAKAVGLTQWRVREGVFLSTVLLRDTPRDVLAYLSTVPLGLADALDHDALASLHIDDVPALIERLHELSEPSARRDILLTD
jgi:lipoate-protein ligase A